MKFECMNKRFRLLSGLALSSLVKGQFSEERVRHKVRPPPPPPTPPPTRPPISVVDLTHLEALYNEHVFRQTTCQTYSMSEYSNNYETQGGGDTDINGGYMRWGLHALQWKGYNHLSAGGTFNEGTANGSGYPQSDWPDNVQCPDKDTLNTLEQPGAGIFDTDPAGTWICVSEPDAHVAAVTAAMSMHYWGTPTYTDAYNCLQDGPWQGWCIVGAAIERVTLCVEGDDPPHEACGWDTFDWTTNLGTIGPCAAQLALDSVEIGAFFDILVGGTQPWFAQNQVVDGADWADHYGDWNWPTTNWDLVFDPPVEASEEAIGTLQKMAAATAEGMLVAKREGDSVKFTKAAQKLFT